MASLLFFFNKNYLATVWEPICDKLSTPLLLP